VRTTSCPQSNRFEPPAPPSEIAHRLALAVSRGDVSTIGE
jgi:hypothetical protein